MACKVVHKCFVSYHHADQDEVEAFIREFDTDGNAFIARCVGVMDQDIIDSNDADYIMRRIREKYLTDSVVTIVMIGKCTWARKYVDWEIAATLRDDPKNKRSGLIAITLPSVATTSKTLPPRLDDNVDGENGYARWWKYPQSCESLANMIETACTTRTDKANLVDNRRALYSYNRTCE